MLLVVRANPAVVRATPMHGGIALLHLLGDFQIHLARTAIEGDIVGDQDLLETMLRTALVHPYAAILKHDFGIDSPQALRAERNSGVVITIRAALHWAVCVKDASKKPCWRCGVGCI